MFNFYRSKFVIYKHFLLRSIECHNKRKKEFHVVSINLQCLQLVYSLTLASFILQTLSTAPDFFSKFIMYSVHARLINLVETKLKHFVMRRSL